MANVPTQEVRMTTLPCTLTSGATTAPTPSSSPSGQAPQPLPQPLDVFEVITWHCTGKKRELPAELTTPRKRVVWPDLDDLGPVEWLDALPGLPSPSLRPAAQP